MKILITGGAGFIGSHITKAYLEKDHQVILIDHKKLPISHPNLTQFQIDIQDKSTLEKIFATEKPDIINHHAAQIDPQMACKNPTQDAQTNIIGTLNLLEAAAKHQIKKFIFASSAAVYGESSEIPTPENAPTNPITPYGISKLSAEKYIQFFHKNHQLNFSILRYSNVYGPGQNKSKETGVIHIFIEQFLKQEPLTIHGNGDQTRDFIHVSDVTKANLLILKKGDNEIFNISTNQETSIQNLANLISNNQEHSSATPNDIQKSCLNNQKAHITLNWQATINLSDGIQQSIKHETSQQ